MGPICKRKLKSNSLYYVNATSLSVLGMPSLEENVKNDGCALNKRAQFISSLKKTMGNKMLVEVHTGADVDNTH